MRSRDESGDGGQRFVEFAFKLEAAFTDNDLVSDAFVNPLDGQPKSRQAVVACRRMDLHGAGEPQRHSFSMSRCRREC